MLAHPHNGDGDGHGDGEGDGDGDTVVAMVMAAMSLSLLSLSLSLPPLSPLSPPLSLLERSRGPFTRVFHAVVLGGGFLWRGWTRVSVWAVWSGAAFRCGLCVVWGGGESVGAMSAHCIHDFLRAIHGGVVGGDFCGVVGLV